MRKRLVLALVTMALLSPSCIEPVVARVEDGKYQALVPTSGQFDSPGADHIPGGFVALSDSDVAMIQMEVSADEVKVTLDGGEAMSRAIEERVIVRDSEGSGPFKAEKEILVLGDDPLVLADLTIDRPVIWPGGFEGSPVITLKPRDPDERGPVVPCGADQNCLLLSSGVEPDGRYEDANNPELDENPVASIEVTETAIVYTMDSDELVEVTRDGEFLTRSCGLSETYVWVVPGQVGLDMDDPVLVQAACPSTPGDTLLTIFESSAMPELARLGPEFGGEWCLPDPNCLLFVPAP